MRSFYIFIRRFCAVLVGAVLFVAGVLKLQDPVGSRMIVQSYLTFFHIYFLWPCASVIGTTLSLVETLLGAALLAGVWRHTVAILTSVMMLFYTALTVILAVENPEMDCGCFGEAIHLTHLQSLVKNLVLCALCAISFLPVRGWYGRCRRIKYVAFSLVAVLTVLLTIRGYRGLPFVDFMSYAPGSQIFDPRDSEASWPDGEAPNILAFYDAMGEYSGNLVLDGRKMVVSIPEPEKMKEEDWAFVRNAVAYSLSAGFEPLVLAASETEASVVFGRFLYTADYKTLYTLNRSNGGLTWIEEGQVIRKWASHRAGSKERLDAELYCEDPLELMVSRNVRGRLTLCGIPLASLAILLLL